MRINVAIAQLNPTYEILDQILYYYIDQVYSYQEILAQGFDPATVKGVIKAGEAE